MGSSLIQKTPSTNASIASLALRIPAGVIFMARGA